MLPWVVYILDFPDGGLATPFGANFLNYVAATFAYSSLASAASWRFLAAYPLLLNSS